MNEQDISYTQKMAKINSSVVIFHNIDNEDFTHHYDGVPWTIEKGEKMALTFPVAKTLAKHLAMKILRKQKVAKGEIGIGYKEKEINLYTDKSVTALMEKIMEQTIDRPAQNRESKEARAKREAEALQNEFKDELDSDPEVNKKDVFEKLDKLGIQYDKRKSTKDLLVILEEEQRNIEEST